jgi:hypothetical protein
MNNMDIPPLVSIDFTDDMSAQVQRQDVYAGEQVDGLLKTLDGKINHLNAEISKSAFDIPNGSPVAAIDFLSSMLVRKDLVGLVTASVGGVINSYNRLSQMFT